jgi:hypothetical protein
MLNAWEVRLRPQRLFDDVADTVVPPDVQDPRDRVAALEHQPVDSQLRLQRGTDS